MKKILIISGLMCALSSFAQNVNVKEFPFDVALCKPDSSPVNSKTALKSDGEPTLLAFWLTTCYPCMMELDAYTRKYAQWQEESPFNLIAVSTDFPKNFQQIKKVAAERKLPFPIFWDANRMFRELLPGGLNGLPQVFLFNQSGELIWHHKGYYSGLEDEMFEIVKDLNGQ